MPFDPNDPFAPAVQPDTGPGNAGEGGGQKEKPPDYGPPDPWAVPYLPPEKGGTNTGGDTTNNNSGDQTDWSSILGIYGMPPDVVAAVQKIFTDNPDTATAIQLALAYIRGTDWYKATYPGIQYGMQNGLFTNEAGYRQYVNAVRQYYKQYLGRDPTGDEITQYLQSGTDPSIVGKTLEGNAYAQTYKPDIEYYSGAFGTGQLSDADLKAYGQEKVGLGSSRGYQLDKMITDAIRRYQGAFGGAAAVPTGTTLGPVGLASTGLAGQRESLSQMPDIGA